MIHRGLVFWSVVAVATAVGLFTVKYKVQDLEERIDRTNQKIVESQEHARFERCHFLTITESALRVEIVYFVTQRDYKRYADIQQAINLEILRRFAAEDITFGIPSRTIFLRGNTGPSIAERT